MPLKSSLHEHLAFATQYTTRKAPYEAKIVCCNNNCNTFTARHLVEMRHYLVAGLRVEVTCRLVGKNKTGLV